MPATQFRFIDKTAAPKKLCVSRPEATIESNQPKAKNQTNSTAAKSTRSKQSVARLNSKRPDRSYNPDPRWLFSHVSDEFADRAELQLRNRSDDDKSPSTRNSSWPNVDQLDGFPFGLILEHSFVQIDGETVFQKADPMLTSKVEIIPISKAVEPYTRLKGFEITRHVPISQFRDAAPRNAKTSVPITNPAKTKRTTI